MFPLCAKIDAFPHFAKRIDKNREKDLYTQEVKFRPFEEFAELFPNVPIFSGCFVFVSSLF